MRTYTPRLVTQKQEGSHNCIGPPPKARGLSPLLGVLRWEDEPPECLSLETNLACIQEIQKAIGNRGNRDYSLKGHTQDLPLVQASAQEFEWFLGHKHLLIMKSILKREKTAGTPLGI